MRDFVTLVRHALDLVGGGRRWKWLVLVASAVLVAGIEALGALLIYTLLGLIAAPDGASVELPLVSGLGELIPSGAAPEEVRLGVAIAVGMTFVVRAVAVITQTYLQYRVVENAGARLSERLVASYLAMPFARASTLNSADLVRDAFDSTQRFVTLVLTPLVTVVAELILVVGLTSLLFAISPLATALVAVVLVPVVWALLRVIQPRLRRLGVRSQAARSGSLRVLQESLGAFRDIVLLRKAGHFVDRYRVQRRALARTEYLKFVGARIPRVFIETSLILIIVGALVTVSLAGREVEALLSTLGVFAYVGLRLQPSIQNVVSGLNSLEFAGAVIDDLSRHLATTDDTAPSTADAPPLPFERSIELRDVSFAYASGSRPVVETVSLEIGRGEFVGICGPTGGGKSTLVDIILGLLPPTEGAVLVDDVDIAGREASWHRQLGVVPQSVYLVDDTLRRNIAFGLDDEDVDDAALWRAVEGAQLVEVVQALPEGIETVVGEGGVRLSGGQRQRVAIARALYVEPQVVVFDEGTSALDAATEHALVDAVHALRGERTIIAVTHRVATIRGADRIIVVDRGSIVSAGPFEAVMAASPLFRSLAR